MFIVAGSTGLARQPSANLQAADHKPQLSLVSPLVLVTKWRVKMSELACRVWHELVSKLAKCFTVDVHMRLPERDVIVFNAP